MPRPCWIVKFNINVENTIFSECAVVGLGVLIICTIHIGNDESQGISIVEMTLIIFKKQKI